MLLTKKAIRIQRILQIGSLLFILLLGMLLRFATANGTIVDHPVRNDGRDYIAYAWNLKFFDVYSKNFDTVNEPGSTAPQPDAYRPPGYPLMLKVLLDNRVDPSFWLRTTRVQAWIACLTLACSTLLAMELLGTWAGLLVGLLVAISPHQSIYVSYFLTETLYGALLMAALGVAVVSLKVSRPRWRYFCAGAAGVLFAATCLVRPTLNQWVPFLLLLSLVPRIRRLRLEVATLGFCFLVAMSPWWVRNAGSTHEVSDPHQMMATVHQGSYPDFMYNGDPATFGYPYAHDPNNARVESSWVSIFIDLRSKFARQPLTMLKWYVMGKTAYFFHWSTPEGWHDMFIYPIWRSPWLTDPMFVLISAIMRALYVPLIICGLLGTLVAFTGKTSELFEASNVDGLRLLALMHLFAIGVHVIGAPFSRYSVPFRPLTFMMGIFFLVWSARNYFPAKPLTSSVNDSYG